MNGVNSRREFWTLAYCVLLVIFFGCKKESNPRAPNGTLIQISVPEQWRDAHYRCVVLPLCRLRDNRLEQRPVMVSRPKRGAFDRVYWTEVEQESAVGIYSPFGVSSDSDVIAHVLLIKNERVWSDWRVLEVSSVDLQKLIKDESGNLVLPLRAELPLTEHAERVVIEGLISRLAPNE